MNLLILKRASILSAILGAIVAAIGIIPFFVGYIFFLVLPFLAAPIVIIYMKKHNQIGRLDMEKSAFLGAIIGLFTSSAFFVVLIPAVLILRFLGNITHLWNYYAYGLDTLITFQTLWLFVIIAVMVVGILALTNSVSAMGTYYIFNQIEKLPEGADEPIDIVVDDGI